VNDATMIDRVSQALRLKALELFGASWPREKSRELAIAALEAMSEPTERMLNEGEAWVSIEGTWSAMIRAALDEQQESGR
jgi:hypothetical protein